MSAETTLLAETLVKLIRDPQYSPEEAAARVVVMLHQVEASAVRGSLGVLQELGRIAGCKATLSFGPYGWTCTMTAPVGTLLSSTQRSALDAVQNVQQAFESAVQVKRVAA